MRMLMRIVGPVCVAIATLLLSACAGEPSVKEGTSQRNLDAMSGPASKVLVMALYPDQNLDVRVVIENAVVDGFRKSGVVRGVSRTAG